MSDYPYEAIVFLGDKDEIVEYTGDEIVRCKDCRYFKSSVCPLANIEEPQQNDYCSYGERTGT